MKKPKAVPTDAPRVDAVPRAHANARARSQEPSREIRRRATRALEHARFANAQGNEQTNQRVFVVAYLSAPLQIPSTLIPSTPNGRRLTKYHRPF